MRPPVVEVIAGVAFDGMGPDAGPLMGAFWKERLRERFPVVQQQPPYSPPIEQFGAPQQMTHTLELSSEFPGARLLASTPDRQELVQLQPGWFACNWRKVQPTDDYDHWPARRASFDLWFSELSEYMASAGSALPKIKQCEVTYVNHIHPNRVWSDLADFGRVFSASLGTVSVGSLEQLTAQAQFRIHDDAGSPCGRLHVKILPAYGRDGRTPLYVFELTARGFTDGGVLPEDFLDRGRKAIVRAFLDLTTPEVQAEWKRGE